MKSSTNSSLSAVNVRIVSIMGARTGGLGARVSAACGQGVSTILSAFARFGLNPGKRHGRGGPRTGAVARRMEARGRPEAVRARQGGPAMDWPARALPLFAAPRIGDPT